ncbi:MrcB family domain-containing protein [Modestobacter sp. SYSU DS0657]
MDLREALSGVAGYSHSAGKLQPAQQHLNAVRSSPPAETPLGLRIRVSGSAFSLPLVPWIALLDPDVTTTATDGLYLVYLYRADISTVFLSMNQGATQHRRVAEQAGAKGVAADNAALVQIANETEKIRAALDPAFLSGRLTTIDLAAPGYLPRAYEVGNIVAAAYPLDDLPENETLATDLQQFAMIYTEAVSIKKDLASKGQIATSSVSEKKSDSKPATAPIFAPKDSAEYFAKVGAAHQKKTRKHESLIKAFGEDVLAAGGVPATNVHPRDLTVDSGGAHWLVEAKTVGPNAEVAVREAIGQLYSYRHFFYRELGEPDPLLLALFSDPIGEALAHLLQSLDIDYVVRDQSSWAGTEAALALIDAAG